MLDQRANLVLRGSPDGKLSNRSKFGYSSRSVEVVERVILIADLARVPLGYLIAPQLIVLEPRAHLLLCEVIALDLLAL
jgi:hypothetical protein